MEEGKKFGIGYSIAALIFGLYILWLSFDPNMDAGTSKLRWVNLIFKTLNQHVITYWLSKAAILYLFCLVPFIKIINHIRKRK